MSGNRAPSCWIRYTDSFRGDVIMQDVSIPRRGDTTNTYYCTLQWNRGGEAGGYCGLQAHHRGNNYIFSLWNSKLHPDVPIDIPFKSNGTITKPFGGEGDGMQAINYSVGWKDDQWYTTLVRRWDHHHHHTFFGYWIHDQTERKWTHLVTMDYPSANADFHSHTNAFIEDWAGTGQHQREVHFQHGYKRQTNHTWFPFTTANWNVLQEESTKNYNNNYNAGVTNGYYFMQSGGNTNPNPSLGTKHVLHNHAMSRHPQNRPIDFSISSATSNNVTWHVDESETPQFSYSVTVDRNPYPFASDVDPEKRSIMLNVGKASEIEVTLEDIIGHHVTKRMVIS